MQVNWLDFFSSGIVLLALWLIPKNKRWWLLYALGCFLWIILHYTKALYFGMVMNSIAFIIGLSNFVRQGV